MTNTNLQDSCKYTFNLPKDARSRKPFADIARQDLERYRQEKQSMLFIQIKLANLKERLRSLSRNLASASRNSGQQEYYYTEDLYAEIAWLEDQYQNRLAVAEQIRSAIEKRLSDIFPSGSPKGMLLYYKYCCEMSHAAIAPKIGYSLSRTNHLHCEALYEYGYNLAIQSNSSGIK